MKVDQYELLSIGEMRRKYGLTSDNRQVVQLNRARVPASLHHLIPLAEFWGVGDDVTRDHLVANAPKEAIEDLKRVIAEHDDQLDLWLAGPEAAGPSFSLEYGAFSAMRMAADFA